MKTFFIGTVSACLLLPIIGAGAAQADPARIPAIGALQPGDLSPGALARFKLEAVSFRALHQTGWTNLGSDEVYVSIHVPARNVATVTQIFEDVDAGETHKIPSNQSCILPIAGVTGPKTFAGTAGDRWSCSPDGAPGPFSFTVVLREHDPSYCPFAPCGFSPGETPGAEPQPLNTLDDFIGRHTVNHSMEELLELQVGQSKVENSLVRGGDGQYQFDWRITRLPDAEPVVSPVTRLQEPNPRE